MKVIMHWDWGHVQKRKVKQQADASNVPVSECDAADDHPETYFEVTEL